jgi:hypothetical protein
VSESNISSKSEPTPKEPVTLQEIEKKFLEDLEKHP